MHRGSAGTRTALPVEQVPACFKISNPEKEGMFWNLKHPAYSCSSFGVFPNVWKPQVWGGATSPARPLSPSLRSRTGPGGARPPKPGEGGAAGAQQCCRSSRAREWGREWGRDWVLLGPGLLGAGAAAAGQRSWGALAGQVQHCPRSQVVGPRGSVRERSRQRGEKCLLVFHYSSKSPRDLVFSSRSELRETGEPGLVGWRPGQRVRTGEPQNLESLLLESVLTPRSKILESHNC